MNLMDAGVIGSGRLTGTQKTNFNLSTNPALRATAAALQQATQRQATAGKSTQRPGLYSGLTQAGASGGSSAGSTSVTTPGVLDQSPYDRQQAILQEQYNRRMAASQAAKDALLKTAQDNFALAQQARQQQYDANVSSQNQNTESSLQQAYIENQLQQRNLGQQLAAAGQSGGAAESTLLGLANSYGSNRGTLENQRNTALADLATALAQGKNEDQQTLNTARSDAEKNYQDNVLGYADDYATAAQQLEEARAEALAKIAAAGTTTKKSSSKSSTAKSSTSTKSASEIADAAAAAEGKTPGRVYNGQWYSEQDIAAQLAQAGMTEAQIAKTLNYNRDDMLTKGAITYR